MTVINPAHILDSYRKTDAVIIVSQNNALKSFDIIALNEAAQSFAGYSSAELANQSLFKLLPERVGATLNEFVEFGDDTHDLLAVLQKVRNFAVRAKDGREVSLRLRIIRGEEVEKNPWFHLVLIDESTQEKQKANRDILREETRKNLTLNDQTGIPNRISVLKNMELLVGAVRKGQVKGSFAVMDINNYDSIRAEFGQAVCNQMHRHIGYVCKQKLRPEDTVGTLSERMLGLVLVDAAQEEARMVLNRLRWIVSATPLQVENREAATQVNIAFAEVDGKIAHTDVFESCERFAGNMRENKVFNSIQLVVTHERRAREDRRKQSIPVAVDRRKQERRG